MASFWTLRLVMRTRRSTIYTSTAPPFAAQTRNTHPLSDSTSSRRTRSDTDRQRGLVFNSHLDARRLRLGQQEHGAQRRNGQRDRPPPPVQRNRHRVETAHVPLAAAAVQRGVAVQHLTPAPAARHAHLIVVPWG